MAKCLRGGTKVKRRYGHHHECALTVLYVQQLFDIVPHPLFVSVSNEEVQGLPKLSVPPVLVLGAAGGTRLPFQGVKCAAEL